MRSLDSLRSLEMTNRNRLARDDRKEGSSR